ncbi:MAG TPA: fumarylacetoacetate hydrolase family protein [Brevefilum fermentans]|jgi:2-keto-4-pentenoate hydratase/2-oxohepta-3-ene-1,7-dioic acid hydratase in catechol pathway|nr:fumarylacetoacetate hydrolase family protein [Brevefilum fermentans]HQA29752.1 fumarylacetoacetate hydrolase family protein [Brevefilum fermentans]
MKILRFETPLRGPHYGWLYQDRVGEIDGDPFGAFRRLDPDLPVDSVRLLPPVLPGKIICVGRNYAAHAQELGNPIGEIPVLFFKPGSSLIGPGDAIVLPPQSQQVQHEAELAVVIGRRGRWIQPEEAMDTVFGYTIANDVTARDLQGSDTTWTRAKGFDTFCPLGPWIETEFDPADALITCHVSQSLRQMGSTRDMVFSISRLIAFISSVMTLDPGDIILTGTPAGVGDLEDGDSVSITIEGLGTLTNPVTSEHRV